MNRVSNLKGNVWTLFFLAWNSTAKLESIKIVWCDDFIASTMCVSITRWLRCWLVHTAPSTCPCNFLETTQLHCSVNGVLLPSASSLSGFVEQWNAWPLKPGGSIFKARLKWSLHVPSIQVTQKTAVENHKMVVSGDLSEFPWCRWGWASSFSTQLISYFGKGSSQIKT